MPIKVLKKQSKAAEDFGKKEWKNANVEHYGEDVKFQHERYFLEEGENEVKGTLEFRIDNGVAFVEYLLVGEKDRGQGIGRSLMERMEELAKKKGAHKIYLQTGLGWDSEGFFKNLGYAQTSQLYNHFHGKNFVEYTKFI